MAVWTDEGREYAVSRARVPLDRNTPGEEMSEKNKDRLLPGRSQAKQIPGDR